MANVFYISDLHLGHAKTTDGTFKNADGSNLRPFASAEEMNNEIIRRWNDVVREQDKVYVLGDVVINKKFLPLIKELKGAKRLVRGNHDIFKTRQYMEVGFKEVYGVRVLDDCILSHIPLHPECITKRFGINVHGHLHGNNLMLTRRGDDIEKDDFGKNYHGLDPRYFNVSVEQINYTPINHEDLMVEARRRFDVMGMPYPRDTWGNDSCSC